MTPPPRSAAALKRETNDLVMPPCDFVPKPHKVNTLAFDRPNTYNMDFQPT